MSRYSSRQIGGGGSAASFAVWQPLLAAEDVIENDNGLLDSWTQDPDTLIHSIALANPSAAGSNDPVAWDNRLWPLQDTFQNVIGIDEIGPWVAWIELLSGLATNDTVGVMVGMSNGPDIATKTMWGRIDSSSTTRRCRAGRDGSVSSAPSGTGSAWGRLEDYARFAPTAGQIVVGEHTMSGADSSKQAITNGAATLAGTSVTWTLAPHIFIAAGGLGVTDDDIVATFRIHVAALKLDGGFP